MGPGHPECPERLDAIEDRLLVSGVFDALERYDAPQAAAADLELAHDRMHVAVMRGYSELLAEDVLAGGPEFSQIDPDTSINVHTWNAALRSAGAGMAATDAVMAGEIENAFCAVRPPGHHATRNQAQGFCALERYHLQRVAVVDFDVHHGNGTENILAGDMRALMIGIFQHPFYPFCGDQNPAANMLNVPIPAYTKGMEIREIIEMTWIPRLEEFQPEMIFISAGFDGHREDDMGQLGLTEQDFAWMTQRIKDIAKRYSKGRIVSLLEGGYVMSPLARSVEAHIRVLADL